jgi:hypothetical protein
MQFFELDYRNYSPWIWKFARKEDYCMVDSRCSVCGKEWTSQKNEDYYDRPLDAVIEKKGNKWTDIIGSGERSFFKIVSQRTLEIWESEGIGTFPAFPITILPPYPKKMTEPPPMYYRLDYKKMIGAELDFEASCFMDIKNCSGCGFSYDWNKTHNLSQFKITSYKLLGNTWNGKDIFSIFHSSKIPGVYCTEKVIDCAAKYKMTNFRFVPFEIAGSATSFHGIDYSVKNWRAKMEKQVEEYKKNFRPRKLITENP